MADSGYTIYTNNPKVQEKYPSLAALYNASVTEVLSAVRGVVHKGAKLVSKPLADGTLPSMNPFKSLIVTEPSAHLDFLSVRLLDEAMTYYKRNARARYKAYNDKMLEDFQFMDLELTTSALASLDAV
jgi:hypothetical protein